MNSFHFREGGVQTSSPLHTSYLRFWLARNARAYTSARSTGFCVIWVCISSSSSSVPQSQWFCCFTVWQMASWTPTSWRREIFRWFTENKKEWRWGGQVIEESFVERPSQPDMPHDGDILLEGLTTVEATNRLKEWVILFHKEPHQCLDLTCKASSQSQIGVYSVTPTQYHLNVKEPQLLVPEKREVGLIFSLWPTCIQCTCA